ncbi:MAG: DUF2461 domain-containing protein [Fimbriimonadaceae bacterium]|nr:DUF2461 domain-containing protein [Fimbriimonadaceae bacterium]
MLGKEYVDFFKELEADNSKEWFEKNKKRFEKVVKGPFEEFVAEVITQVQKHDKAVQLLPKDAIFRIYRDVRFSKDKTPYKTFMAAVVSPGGRKDLQNPGIYMQCSHKTLAIAGGVYECDPETMIKIRRAIMADPKTFHKVTEAKEFVEKFGEIQGDRNKVLPEEFKAAAAAEPYVANKQWYFWVELPEKVVSSPKIVDTVMEHWHVARPVNEYFAKIMK